MTLVPSSSVDTSHLSIVLGGGDPDLTRIHQVLAQKLFVDDRTELEAALGRLLADPPAPGPRTLDLIGHSTAEHAVLLLGDWPIDATSPKVTAFFRGLADHDVLPRLGVRTLRLLGCQTATTARGLATIRKLSDILGLEVSGTTQMLGPGHYDTAGFRDDCEHLLVRASDIHQSPAHLDAASRAPYPRVLDVERLLTYQIAGHRSPWPLRLVTVDVARRLLQLLRRSEGGEMPGLLVAPRCEIALPATRAGWFHRLEVLGDGEFVRARFEDAPDTGVVFPVTEPQLLLALVDALPVAG